MGYGVQWTKSSLLLDFSTKAVPQIVNKQPKAPTKSTKMKRSAALQCQGTECGEVNFYSFGCHILSVPFSRRAWSARRRPTGRRRRCALRALQEKGTHKMWQLLWFSRLMVVWGTEQQLITWLTLVVRRWLLASKVSARRSALLRQAYPCHLRGTRKTANAGRGMPA